MSDAFHVGAIALQTQQRALDAIANNIANINTTGFKRTEVSFADVVASSADRSTMPAAIEATPDALAGVMLSQLLMMNEQGAVERTGGAMDLAIEGAGFIELMGTDGRSLLWRGGTMKVGEDGLLATSNGLPLKAAISVPQDASAIIIARDGTVSATVADAAAPVEIGRIELIRVDDPGLAERLDGGLYRLPEGQQLISASAGEDGAGSFVQGALERSNVALTDEMVRMMLVQRAYAANAQMVQAADQMMAIANGLRQ